MAGCLAAQRCPGPRLSRAGPRSRRTPALRITAVLQQQPAPAPGADDAGALRARLAALLEAPWAAPQAGPASAAHAAAPTAQAPAAAAEAGTVWYFAFGANLSQATLLRRDVRPLSRDGAAVVDPNMRMVFKHRGGYATLESLPPAAATRYPPLTPRVHGVLYKLGEGDLEKLAKAEGGYVLRDVEVETYDGRVVTARAFVSGPLASLAAEVTPTEKYMRALREGAADNYLDPLYQAWLSGVETVPSAGLPQEYYDTPSRFIAYGFLAIVGLLVVGFFA